MNIEATTGDLRNTAEALKLAAVLDDRIAQPDKARIAAWAEQIHRHNLQRDDLLNGLQAFYDSPSAHPIGVGDLVDHARRIKRARLDKEADQDREARQTANDHKADTHGLAAAFTPGPVAKRTERLEEAVHRLETCHGRREAMAAIREYVDAKREAGKSKPKRTKR